jgi:16S rRNA processing protein RimM
LNTAVSDVSSLAGAQDPAWPEDAVEVGRVLDAWGVKGWVKVQSFASDPQALLDARRWYLRPPEDGALKRPVGAAAAFPPHIAIISSREHGSVIVAQVRGVDDRTGAESLRGARIFLARGVFPKPRAGEYYWVDLIGLSVVNRDGVPMGTVVGLIDTGPHSVLRLAKPDSEANPDGEERLIPFVAAYVDDVSLPERRITVDWGLDY